MPRILVIDDDPLVRETIQYQLESAGHDVTTADNGDTGLDALENDGINLVITDIIMPDKEGIEFILTARRLGYKQPIIAISGALGSLADSGAGDYLSFAKRLGASAVLQKPISARYLLRSVALLLENSGMKRSG